eukprot:6851248-Alexandrium_andersonii.AAC.1
MARNLADWGICSDPSFANAGGRLVRKPGSVPTFEAGDSAPSPLLPLPRGPLGRAQPLAGNRGGRCPRLLREVLAGSHGVVRQPESGGAGALAAPG